MDPISLAGLAIAVFDQLWKVGERTALLTSAYQDFDQDSKTIENKIRHEINRTKALRVLLFQPSQIYDNRCLFDQFSDDVQAQIHIFLEELKSVLEEALHLLDRQHSTSQFTTTIPTNGDSLKPPQALHHRASETFRRWRWAFKDKERVQKIVMNFTDLNRRIHENVQLWCHATTLGVDARHLKHLGDDSTSKELGFDVDAKLQLLVCDAAEPQQSLEIRDSSLQDCAKNPTAKIEDRFSICTWNGRTVLLEYRNYAPEDLGLVPLNERKRSVTEKLAALLHQPKELSFRTPACVGWYVEYVMNRVAIVFSLPENVELTPLTLLKTLQLQIKPSLGERFRLAHVLAKSISQLQLVGWVHESFRSDNILFFLHPATEPRDEEPEPNIKFHEPWIFGFTNSRPEDAFSSGRGDACLARNIYRHPSRQGVPTQPFRKIHDVYALGVVLLEIGLWQPALTMEREKFKRVTDRFLIQKFLIRKASKTLSMHMGEKYKDAVVGCLAGDFGADDASEGLAFQQALRTKVVDVLEQAALSV